LPLRRVLLRGRRSRAARRNRASDIFLRDRALGTTTRLSVGPGGREGDGDSYFAAISANGQRILFTSDAGNLVANDINGVSDVFLRDLRSGA
jgi:Tol biopolymer transport system component